MANKIPSSVTPRPNKLTIKYLTKTEILTHLKDDVFGEYGLNLDIKDFETWSQVAGNTISVSNGVYTMTVKGLGGDNTIVFDENKIISMEIEGSAMFTITFTETFDVDLDDIDVSDYDTSEID